MNDWKPVQGRDVALVVAALALAAWLWLSSAGHWVRILDDANLVFHEAGHPIFGLLGPTLGLYGGTIGQLVFPAVSSFTFWKQRQPAAFALCSGWFFENFLGIGRYMSDARSQVLPLVGGGEHDWTAIFSNWGVLPYDRLIGHLTIALGLLGMAACALWIFNLFTSIRTR
jgi:hypothetical protein